MSKLKIRTSDCELIIPEGQSVEISGDGLVLEFNAQGSFTLTRNDKPVAASRPERTACPRAGDVMPDGSICGGISPKTGYPFFATAQDAPALMNHWEAVAYAKDLDEHGSKDWSLPTKAELDVLYRNRNAGGLHGTFNESGSFPAGHYRSSSGTIFYNSWLQRFSDGGQVTNKEYRAFAVRCVRR